MQISPLLLCSITCSLSLGLFSHRHAVVSSSSPAHALHLGSPSQNSSHTPHLAVSHPLPSLRHVGHPPRGASVCAAFDFTAACGTAALLPHWMRPPSPLPHLLDGPPLFRGWTESWGSGSHPCSSAPSTGSSYVVSAITLTCIILMTSHGTPGSHTPAGVKLKDEYLEINKDLPRGTWPLFHRQDP